MPIGRPPEPSRHAVEKVVERAANLPAEPERTLTVAWQRLVNAEGLTCERCAATGQEVRAAVEVLSRALPPLGIRPVLDTRTINEAAFLLGPPESNRIWIDGRPLEEWIGARVGSSACCAVCAGNDCRTLEIGGTTFEVIPAQLIVRAALMAAAGILGD